MSLVQTVDVEFVYCCEQHGRVPKEERDFLHVKLPSKFEQVNAWKRKQHAYFCLGCNANFSGKGSWQVAAKHERETGHQVAQGTLQTSWRIVSEWHFKKVGKREYPLQYVCLECGKTYGENIDCRRRRAKQHQAKTGHKPIIQGDPNGKHRIMKWEEQKGRWGRRSTAGQSRPPPTDGSSILVRQVTMGNHLSYPTACKSGSTVDSQLRKHKEATSLT